MRKNNKMTLQDRLTIKQMYYEGKSFREIGKAIGYSHTAVSNEIKRNGRMLQPSANNLRRTKGRVYYYNGNEAHKVANMRKAKTLRRNKSVVSKKLWKHVCDEAVQNKKSFEKSLIEYKTLHPEEKVPCLKTLYNFYARIIKENTFILNFKIQKYRKRHIDDGSLLHNFGKSIDLRPDEINNRETFGHLEIDCIESSKNENTALLTIVERKTRFSKIYYLENQDSFHVNTQLRKFIKEFGIHSIKSITTDNGSEFKKLNKVFTTDIIPIYFCHPGKPYEKGTVERKNREIRKFFKKGTDFSGIKQEEINRVTKIINGTHMQTIGMSPNQFLNEFLSVNF